MFIVLVKVIDAFLAVFLIVIAYWALWELFCVSKSSGIIEVNTIEVNELSCE